MLVCHENLSNNRDNCVGVKVPRKLVVGRYSYTSYLWGTVACKLSALKHKFNGRIEQIPLGLSKLHFEICNVLHSSKVFHDSATEPYTESEQHFYHEAIKAPALDFFSDTDQPGTEMQTANHR